MTDDLQTLPMREAPARAVAGLCALPGAVGAHVGIVYCADDEGTRRVLHQAWHHDTRDESVDCFVDGSAKPCLWVQPGLDVDEQNDLRTMARLVASRLSENRLPYALLRRDATVGQDGVVALGQSIGLTCATFVLLLFAAASVPLLDEPSWEPRSEPRRRADETAQEALVQHLERRWPEHARRVREESGCTRFRAEEVAAASHLCERPVAFSTVEPLGAALLGRLGLGAA